MNFQFVAAIIFSVFISAIAIGVLIYPLWLRLRRNQLMEKPFPKHWINILERNLPAYGRFSPWQQKQLQGFIQVFLQEKQFIGCQGLQVMEEMRVTIAAIACLLLFGDRRTYFPNLRSILIYPHAYVVRETSINDANVVEEKMIARLGESWTKDQVIVSWEQIVYDIHHWQDGHNLILHEFAHQLDQEDGIAEGVPILPRALDYEAWSRVMTNTYLALCDQVEHNRKTILDYYGATNPAEFFAVATETFFEKPKQLQQKHPSLYELLQRYYRLDPLDLLDL